MNDTFFDIADYGMYSAAGNKSIKQKFIILINKLGEEPSPEDIVKAIYKFIKSYRSMENTKSYSEAGDTAVRESVWFTLCKVGKEFNIPEEVLDWIWFQ